MRYIKGADKVLEDINYIPSGYRTEVYYDAREDEIFSRQLSQNSYLKFDEPEIYYIMTFWGPTSNAPGGEQDLEEIKMSDGNIYYLYLTEYLTINGLLDIFEQWVNADMGEQEKFQPIFEDWMFDYKLWEVHDEYLEEVTDTKIIDEILKKQWLEVDENGGLL